VNVRAVTVTPIFEKSPNFDAKMAVPAATIRKFAEKLRKCESLQKEVLSAVRKEHQFAVFESRRELLEAWLHQGGKFEALVAELRETYSMRTLRIAGIRNPPVILPWNYVLHRFWSLPSLGTQHGDSTTRDFAATVHAVSHAVFSFCQRYRERLMRIKSSENAGHVSAAMKQSF
jgi:hypothetical protein